MQSVFCLFVFVANFPFVVVFSAAVVVVVSVAVVVVVLVVAVCVQNYIENLCAVLAAKCRRISRERERERQIYTLA